MLGRFYISSAVIPFGVYMIAEVNALVEYIVVILNNYKDISARSSVSIRFFNL